MRTQIILIILVLVAAAFADDIDLGNVYITGETEQIDDDIKFKQDLSKFWVLDNMDKFAYYPTFSAKQIEPPETKINNRNLALMLDAGNTNLLDFRALYQSSPWLRFSTALNTEELKNDDSIFLSEIGWHPVWEEHKLIANVKHKKYGDEFTQLTGFDADYDYKNEILMFEKVMLENLNIFVGYKNITQDSLKEDDVDLKLRTDWDADIVKGNLNFNHLIGAASFDATGFYTGFSFMDETGIWLAADERTMYASVVFRKDFSLLNNVNLSICNKPELSSHSREELLKENNFQNIQMNSLQAKAPLNAFIKAEINGQVPLTLFYNVKGLWDQRNYTPPGSEMIDGMYWQKLGFCAAYEYRDFEFRQKLFYHKTCEVLTFLPEFESKTTLKYSYDKLTTSLEFSFYSGRKDFAEEFLNDAYLVNLFADYNLLENLHINLSIDNILNQDYYIYHDVYNDDFRVKLGCIWELF